MAERQGAPILSFVVAARNDDHGGNLQSRMQVFVSALLEQCRRRDLRCELVVVEWNPPADKLPLAATLDWGARGEPCKVRIIEVPPRVHQTFAHSEGLPLFQMIAKNVGIRRATGRFILATNIDLIFSNELMDFLASDGLRHDRMYRLDRYDVPASVPTLATLDEQLEFCRNNVIRVARRWGTVDPLAAEADGWPRWRRSARQVMDVLHSGLQDRGILPVREPSRLHENACGDFTLMARERWIEVQGYPELEMYSMFIDGLLIHAARNSGVQEVILPESHRIYHMEHGAGSGWTPEGEEKLRSRLEASKVPQLSFQDYVDMCIEMRRRHGPLSLNRSDWGLASVPLRESRPQERLSPSQSGEERIAK